VTWRKPGEGEDFAGNTSVAARNVKLASGLLAGQVAPFAGQFVDTLAGVAAHEAGHAIIASAMSDDPLERFVRNIVEDMAIDNRPMAKYNAGLGKLTHGMRQAMRDKQAPGITRAWQSLPSPMDTMSFARLWACSRLFECPEALIDSTPGARALERAAIALLDPIATGVINANNAIALSTCREIMDRATLEIVAELRAYESAYQQVQATRELEQAASDQAGQGDPDCEDEGSGSDASDRSANDEDEDDRDDEGSAQNGLSDAPEDEDDEDTENSDTGSDSDAPGIDDEDIDGTAKPSEGDSSGDDEGDSDASSDSDAESDGSRDSSGSDTPSRGSSVTPGSNASDDEDSAETPGAFDPADMPTICVNAETLDSDEGDDLGAEFWGEVDHELDALKAKQLERRGSNNATQTLRPYLDKSIVASIRNAYAELASEPAKRRRVDSGRIDKRRLAFAGARDDVFSQQIDRTLEGTLVVLLDFSGSVGNANIRLSKQAGASVYAALKPTPIDVYVYAYGVMNDDAPDSVIQIAKPQRVIDFDMAEDGNGTPTGQAFRAAMRDVHPRGQSVIIHVTDGQPDSLPYAVNAMNDARRAGWKIINVMIGNAFTYPSMRTNNELTRAAVDSVQMLRDYKALPEVIRKAVRDLTGRNVASKGA
jgi:hypothetical protein